MLKKMPFDLKNWRPTILVLTSRKNHNYSLLKYGTMFECNKGILSVVSFLDGDLEKVKPERNNELSRLNTYAKENNLEIFPEVIASTDFDVALDVFLQGHSIGPIKPNIVMTAWPKIEFANRLAKHIRVLRKLSLSSVIMFNKDEIITLIDLGYRDGILYFDKELQLKDTKGVGKISMDSMSVIGDFKKVCIFDDIREFVKNYPYTITYDILTKLKEGIKRNIKH